MSAPREDFDPLRWFTEQVKPHQAALHNWLRLRFPSLTDPDDVVQEALLRVWRARQQGPITAAKAFLFATARNLAIDAVKKQHAHVGRSESHLEQTLDARCDPAEATARSQEIDLLHEALAALPERCRQIFTLRRIHGLPQKEIAARLGISEKTVEAQNVIAMHKCMRFFAAVGRAPDPRGASDTELGALPPAPQHA